MYQEPTQFIIALFPEEQAAQTAYIGLKDAQKAKDLAGMRESAVIRKNAEGKAHVWEDEDASGSEGAMIGGVVGAVAGLILGPGAVLTGAAGAAIGGLFAKLQDSGFDNKSLKALADSLKPGSSALLLVVDDVAIRIFSERLEKMGAEIITDHMDAEVVEKLQAEYTAFASKLKEIGADGLLAEDQDEIARGVDAERQQHKDQYRIDPSTLPRY